MIEAPLTVAIHSLGTGAREQLIADVREGLSRTPKQLPPRWFYDERGSLLFEEITELDEYYQTRTERAILQRWAPSMIEAVRPESLVEIGAGSSAKTRVLLGAARLEGSLSRFVPFDISAEMLTHSARALIDEFPGLNVYAMVGDFAEHLAAIPRFGRQLIVFLGSTIGNFDDEERGRFLAGVRSLMAGEDAFALGVDLVKDRRRLVAAYDDSRGVTAEFNRNVLRVINRELDATFDVDAFEHVALFDEAHSRIEMHLQARVAMTVSIPGAGMRVGFAAGERLRTEISVKFTRESIERDLAAAKLRADRWYTDSDERFAVVLARPA